MRRPITNEPELLGLAMAGTDGDGLVDIVKTLFADDMPALCKNEGKRFFVERSMAAGLKSCIITWATGSAELASRERTPASVEA